MPSVISPSSEREIRSLVIQAKRLTDERALGAYRSAFRGQGIEFEEVREYVPGDDIRSIDWKVTARSGRPFIKSYREERELSVMLVCDLSSSTVSGTKGSLRLDVINQISSILTLVAMYNRDRVGLLTFSNQVIRFFKPERKRSSHMRILRELLDDEGREILPGTDYIGAIKHLRNILRRRSTIFFLSDFAPNPLTPGSELAQEFRALSRRHDLTLVRVADPSERELPSAGIWPFMDPETGEEFLLDLSNIELRLSILEKVKEEGELFKKGVAESGSDLLEISTTDNVVSALRAFFERRSRGSR